VETHDHRRRFLKHYCSPLAFENSEGKAGGSPRATAGVAVVVGALLALLA
jgi:hypothetical protein